MNKHPKLKALCNDCGNVFETKAELIQNGPAYTRVVGSGSG